MTDKRCINVLLFNTIHSKGITFWLTTFSPINAFRLTKWLCLEWKCTKCAAILIMYFNYFLCCWWCCCLFKPASHFNLFSLMQTNIVCFKRIVMNFVQLPICVCACVASMKMCVCVWRREKERRKVGISQLKTIHGLNNCIFECTFIASRRIKAKHIFDNVKIPWFPSDKNTHQIKMALNYTANMLTRAHFCLYSSHNLFQFFLLVCNMNIRKTLLIIHVFAVNYLMCLSRNDFQLRRVHLFYIPNKLIASHEF